MTLGATGYYNGNSVVVTCGHTFQAVGDTIRYISGSGSVIGSVLYHRFANYYGGDFEIISVNTSVFNISNQLVPGNRAIIGTTTPAVNEVIMFYGSYTAQVSYAKVEEHDLVVECKYEDASGTEYVTYVGGLTRTCITSGAVTKGDSGGPVFATSTGGYLQCGIIHGYGSSDTDILLYYSPMSFLSVLGFSLKVS